MNIAEAAAYLTAQDEFLILTHVRPDGDTLCSAAALCHGLRSLGKTAYCLKNPDMTPRYVPFISDYLAPEGYAPQTVLSVDTATAQMVQKNAGGYGQCVDLAIDHHMSNTLYAGESLVLPRKAACGEIILDLLRAMDCPIDETVAGLLYIAVSTDSGCFKYSNVNADTFRCAADLLDAGAPHTRLNRIFHRAKSRPRLALEGYILSHLELYRDEKVVLVAVSDAVMAELGATEDDTDDIASLCGQVESSVISITMRDLKEGGTKLSVRTTAEANANEICAILGGGGHKAAAGCSLEGVPMDEARKQILAAVDQVYKG